MKRMHPSLLAVAMLIAVAAVPPLTLNGCRSLDVVGETAKTTFRTLTAKTADAVALDEATSRWVLTSSGGERFEWSTDFSAAGPDFRVAFDASPFLAAGLDPAGLPAERYVYDAGTRTLSLDFEIGDDAFTYAGDPTAAGTFDQIVAVYRPIVGYHAQLDHYGIALGDGNMFEWAKDLTTNEKDIVFVLNPAPFIAAGVDPATVQGWVFGKVQVKDDAGATVEVDKFLKPYNLD